MTTTPNTDTVDLGDLVSGLFKLAGINLIEDAAPEPETETKEPEDTIDCFEEAARILRDLEDEAVDKGDTDLALAVADRWITLGINS